MTVIDVHAHVFPRLSRAEGRVLVSSAEPWLREHGDGTGMMMTGEDEFRPVTAPLWDPHAYTDRFHVDSAVFEPTALELLVRVMGAGRVMLGTDYPFPLGEQEPGAVIRSCPRLTESDRAAMLGGNAREFFGLPEGLPARVGQSGHN